MSSGNILHGLYRHRSGKLVPVGNAVPVDASVTALLPAATAKEVLVPLSPGDPAPVEEFDPARFSVAEVVAYLAANPADVTRVIELEKAGKARKSIVG
jgi:hypothetical protein